MAYGRPLQRRIYYGSPLLLKNAVASLYGCLQAVQRYGTFYRYHRDSLTRSQWYSNEQLEEIQFRKVKEFVSHAKQHCKYYGDLFYKYDFEPQKMQSLSDLSAIPILTKETVRRERDILIADNLKEYNARWSQTSGTTGTGLQFPVSSECFQREYAFRALHHSWMSVREGEKVAYCLGHPVADYDRQKPPFWVYDFANNWLILSSYHLSERNLRHYIEELERFNPRLLGGYPSSIYLLALANKHFGKRVSPRAIYTSSETLFDFQREMIEESFGCKVFTWYANSEMCGNIAECEKGKYHLMLEHSYVEFVDNNEVHAANGREGRMVCTGFGNYAMPLIRYDIGDIAVLSKGETCECGRGGGIVERLVGRTEDYVIAPDGRYVGRLDHLFKDSSHVKMAQIVQNRRDEINIRIVKESNYNKRDEDKIVKEARVRLGSSVKVQFEYVDEIERTRTGKYRFIISNIQKKVPLESGITDD